MRLRRLYRRGAGTPCSTGASCRGSVSFWRRKQRDRGSLSAQIAPAGTFGSQGRNSFRGPDLFSYDASLFRNFSVGETFKLELRGEAYNVTNTTNYTAPQSTFGSPNFGTATRTFNGVGGRQFPVGASGLDCCFNQLGRDGLSGLCVSESQID